MADQTGIEWTDATWNPVRGCSRVSEGCRNCYAELVAARFSGPGQPYHGLARRRSNGDPQWTGVVRVIEEHMNDPLRWRKARRIFVNSMSDLFHEKLEYEDIVRVFAVMMLADHHQFQILTKRPERMQAIVSCTLNSNFADDVWFAARAIVQEGGYSNYDEQLERHSEHPEWPLANVWLGTSVENQEAADKRIPFLLETPAEVRFLSCEPLLGALTFPLPCKGSKFWSGLDWVIVGGESGPHARPMDVQWARSIVEQSSSAGVSVFVKQLGAEPGFRLEDEARRGNAMPGFHHFDEASQLYIKRLDSRKGGDMAEWPEDLRVREFPRQLEPSR